MVRLKDITVWINWDNMTFQFQYGAIKSIKDSIMNPYLNLFQFQYGAIKSKQGK